ncbi:hypothetical protein [Paenibacillus sp. GYB003]|uniref:hypothetical protein n=1 Tax=Paenibacillus sp. GYB003 TaxID=2994392 RepID=UPI003FA72DA8
MAVDADYGKQGVGTELVRLLREGLGERVARMALGADRHGLLPADRLPENRQSVRRPENEVIGAGRVRGPRRRRQAARPGGAQL